MRMSIRAGEVEEGEPFVRDGHWYKRVRSLGDSLIVNDRGSGLPCIVANDGANRVMLIMVDNSVEVVRGRTWSVSLCLSIEAGSEEEARVIFEHRVRKGEWESGSMDSEEEEVVL